MYALLGYFLQPFESASPSHLPLLCDLGTCSYGLPQHWMELEVLALHNLVRICEHSLKGFLEPAHR